MDALFQTDQAMLGSMRADEELLLKASILPLPQARQAWEEFCRRTPDIEKLENDSYRYFPLIVRNLAGSTNPVGHLARLQSVSRHSWARRQQELARMLPLFQCLKKEGIEFILLKGLALSFFYQPYHGESYLLDVGFLVHEADLLAAVSVLKEQGWHAPLSMEEAIGAGACGRQGPPFSLRNGEGHLLTLQTRLLPGAVLPRAYASLWRKAGEAEVLGEKIRVLHPLHQFLHTCALGARKSPGTAIFPWLTDAAQLLTLGLSWRRLEVVAHHFGVVASVRMTLMVLDHLGFPLPPEAVKYWRAMAVEPEGDPFASWDKLDNEIRMRGLESRLRLAEARINKIEGSPPICRHHTHEKTRALAEKYLRQHPGAGLFTLWRESLAYLKTEHHLRPYNRRARFWWLVTSGYLKSKN